MTEIIKILSRIARIGGGQEKGEDSDQVVIVPTKYQFDPEVLERVLRQEPYINPRESLPVTRPENPVIEQGYPKVIGPGSRSGVNVIEVERRPKVGDIVFGGGENGEQKYPKIKPPIKMPTQTPDLD